MLHWDGNKFAAVAKEALKSPSHHTLQTQSTPVTTPLSHQQLRRPIDDKAAITNSSQNTASEPKQFSDAILEIPHMIQHTPSDMPSTPSTSAWPPSHITLSHPTPPVDPLLYAPFPSPTPATDQPQPVFPVIDSTPSHTAKSQSAGDVAASQSAVQGVTALPDESSFGGVPFVHLSVQIEFSKDIKRTQS